MNKGQIERERLAIKQRIAQEDKRKSAAVNGKQRMSAEQRESFAMSEGYVRMNVAVYMAYELATLADTYAAQVEEGLRDSGLTLGELFSPLHDMQKGYERFERNFHKIFFTNARDCDIEKSRYNIDSVLQFVSKCEEEAVQSGLLYNKYRRTRKDMGKGCDTCRKWNTEHCAIAKVFDEAEKMGCMGWQDKD